MTRLVLVVAYDGDTKFAAHGRSPLPERLDEARIEAWVIDTHLAHLHRSRGSR